MRFQIFATCFYLASLTCAAPPVERDASIIAASGFAVPAITELEKRRGGGGGGGGRGGGSSGGSSGGRTGGSGTGTGSGSRTYSYQSNSNVGGQTRSGSGTPPLYGNRYAGGATVPYKAGAAGFPRAGITPFALFPLAVLPGVWLYSAYGYHYPNSFRYNDNGRQVTCNVTCLCQEETVCGCDPDYNNQTFIDSVATANNTSPNGAPVNSSLAQTVNYPNGTCITFLNGTLENGTTAPGGTDPSSDDEVSPAAKLIINYGGYWIMAATVFATTMAL